MHRTLRLATPLTAVLMERTPQTPAQSQSRSITTVKSADIVAQALAILKAGSGACLLRHLCEARAGGALKSLFERCKTLAYTSGAAVWVGTFHRVVRLLQRAAQVLEAL